MYRSTHARPPLTLIVILLSAVFGVALVVEQMNSSLTPASQQVISATNPPSLLVASESSTVTPEPPKHFLSIPSLGVTARIIHLLVEGPSWDISGLGNNVGHLLGTSWFDDAVTGNIVLVGHVELRDGGRGIFADVTTLPLGETIVVHSGTSTRRYIVEASYETEPTDLAPLYSSPEEIVTLITCSDYDFLSNTYLRRHIVVARAVDQQ